VYNNYVITTPSGKVVTGGYMGANDRLRVISPHGQNGAVHYGDEVALAAPNGRYLQMLVEASGAINAHAKGLSSLTNFAVTGGDGPVMMDDRVSFKSIYGYLTATPSGLNGAASQLTSLQRFWLQAPGVEDGNPARPALVYGTPVQLHSVNGNCLQSDANGMITIAPGQGSPCLFDVLSPMRKTGVVQFGDMVVLRAQNGKLLSTGLHSPYTLSATAAVATEESVFRIVAGWGAVHDFDKVALRIVDKGYVSAIDDAAKITIDQDGHFVTSQMFTLSFDLHQKL